MQQKCFMRVMNDTQRDAYFRCD